LLSCFLLFSFFICYLTSFLKLFYLYIILGHGPPIGNKNAVGNLNPMGEEQRVLLAAYLGTEAATAYSRPHTVACFEHIHIDVRLATFVNAATAAKGTGVPQSHISRILNKKQNYAKGLTFCFIKGGGSAASATSAASASGNGGVRKFFQPSAPSSSSTTPAAVVGKKEIEVGKKRSHTGRVCEEEEWYEDNTIDLTEDE
jgi:hypothetical protein